MRWRCRVRMMVRRDRRPSCRNGDVEEEDGVKEGSKAWTAAA